MTARRVSLSAALLCSALLFAGCNKYSPANPGNMQYAAPINAYWSAHPSCLWPQPVKMPTQKDTDKTDRTAAYDALTDIGFLQRMQAEKKTFIFGSKQVSDYDLTPQGRSAWVPAPNNPGYGNFCFGHRSVMSVDTYTQSPGNSTAGSPSTVTVNYHYAIKDAAQWTSNADIRAAFPQMAVMLATPQPATATLSQTSSGWQMNTPPGSTSQTTGQNGDNPGSPANDYGVVGTSTAR
jgi:hypothetical protein